MKLNRKGYMTIEIILASVVTFVIAFFLIDITIKLSSNTDDAYSDTVLITDKTLITKNITENLENDICKHGNISSVDYLEEEYDYNKMYYYCDIYFDDGEMSSLEVRGNVIQYVGVNNNKYSKDIDKSLSDITLTSSNSNGYYNFKISGTNIFIDENYDMNIFVYNGCE